MPKQSQSEAELATYEAEAERALEEEMNSSEDEDEYCDRHEMNNLKKRTYISGTIDIDILLGKDETAKDLVAFDEAEKREKETHENQEKVNKGKPMKEFEETPWWMKSKYPLQYSTSTKSIGKVLEDEQAEYGTNNVEEKAEASNYVEDEEPENVVEDEASNVIGDEEEDGDWEWDYYDSEAEEEEVQDDEEESLECQTVKQSDVRTPWIVNGLSNLIPLAPKLFKATHAEDEEDEESLSQNHEESEACETSSMKRTVSL